MNRRAVAIVLCLLVSAVVVGGCRPSSSKQPRTAIEKIPGEPIIRVRIERDADEITFNGPTKIQLRPADREGESQLLDTPFTIRRSGEAWDGPWNDDAPRPADTLVLAPVGPSELHTGANTWPGHLRLVPAESPPADEEQDDEPAGFDVVNHVGIETYLPGVLEKELYANFQPATYLAQAITARTYAIARSVERGPGSHYDVEATTASQVYAGASERPIARRAAADTAGLVLAYNDRIFSAYFSSTCGGLRQSPTDAFGGPSNVTPLEPHTSHDWCRISPRYEWGPVQRDRQELSRRIAAWGAARELIISRIGTIRTIRIASRNSLGRPTRFRLNDESGRRFELRADSLRHAANHNDDEGDLEPIEGEDRLFSGHFDVEVEGDRVRFINGRGFGHGVGFCQYGAEGMARAGHDPKAILAESYPGARIQKAY